MQLPVYFISSPPPSCPVWKLPYYCLSSDSYHSLPSKHSPCLPSLAHNPSSMWLPGSLPKHRTDQATLPLVQTFAGSPLPQDRSWEHHDDSFLSQSFLPHGVYRRLALCLSDCRLQLYAGKSLSFISQARLGPGEESAFSSSQGLPLTSSLPCSLLETDIQTREKTAPFICRFCYLF